MDGYSISEVENITGVKTHVLRYWEQIIPSLVPQKDVGGHRIYTQRDVDVIRRLKFLIYKRGFSVENAWKKIVQEADSTHVSDMIIAIRKCRAELNESYRAFLKIRF